MPILKQLICTVISADANTGFNEYDVKYGDGRVECYLHIPDESTQFRVQLQSHGYIAPGLSMFVYIDGKYACNRNRQNLTFPKPGEPQSTSEVSFVVRQDERMQDSNHQMWGIPWVFAPFSEGHRRSADEKAGASRSRKNYGVIEVIVLRCHGDRRPSHPLSTFGPHPNSEILGLTSKRGTWKFVYDDAGLEHHAEKHKIPFGCDGADDDSANDRPKKKDTRLMFVRKRSSPADVGIERRSMKPKEKRHQSEAIKSNDSHLSKDKASPKLASDNKHETKPGATSSLSQHPDAGSDDADALGISEKDEQGTTEDSKKKATVQSDEPNGKPKEVQKGRDKDVEEGEVKNTQKNEDQNKQKGEDQNKQKGENKNKQKGEDQNKQKGENKNKQKSKDKKKQNGEDKSVQEGRRTEQTAKGSTADARGKVPDNEPRASNYRQWLIRNSGDALPELVRSYFPAADSWNYSISAVPEPGGDSSSRNKPKPSWYTSHLGVPQTESPANMSEGHPFPSRDGRSKVSEEGVSHYVAKEYPTKYAHRLHRANYIDSLEAPYAKFVFKYRDKAAIEAILGMTIDDSLTEAEKKLAKTETQEELVAEMVEALKREEGDVLIRRRAALMYIDAVGPNIPPNVRKELAPQNSTEERIDEALLHIKEKFGVSWPTLDADSMIKSRQLQASNDGNNSTDNIHQANDVSPSAQPKSTINGLEEAKVDENTNKGWNNQGVNWGGVATNSTNQAHNNDTTSASEQADAAWGNLSDNTQQQAANSFSPSKLQEQQHPSNFKSPRHGQQKSMPSNTHIGQPTLEVGNSYRTKSGSPAVQPTSSPSKVSVEAPQWFLQASNQGEANASTWSKGQVPDNAHSTSNAFGVSSQDVSKLHSSPRDKSQAGMSFNTNQSNNQAPASQPRPPSNLTTHSERQNAPIPRRWNSGNTNITVIVHPPGNDENGGAQGSTFGGPGGFVVDHSQPSTPSDRASDHVQNRGGDDGEDTGSGVQWDASKQGTGENSSNWSQPDPVIEDKGASGDQKNATPTVWTTVPKGGTKADLEAVETQARGEEATRQNDNAYTRSKQEQNRNPGAWQPQDGKNQGNEVNSGNWSTNADALEESDNQNNGTENKSFNRNTWQAQGSNNHDREGWSDNNQTQTWQNNRNISNAAPSSQVDATISGSNEGPAQACTYGWNQGNNLNRRISNSATQSWGSQNYRQHDSDNNRNEAQAQNQNPTNTRPPIPLSPDHSTNHNNNQRNQQQSGQPPTCSPHTTSSRSNASRYLTSPIAGRRAGSNNSNNINNNNNSGGNSTGRANSKPSDDSKLDDLLLDGTHGIWDRAGWEKSEEQEKPGEDAW